MVSLSATVQKYTSTNLTELLELWIWYTNVHIRTYSVRRILYGVNYTIYVQHVVVKHLGVCVYSMYVCNQIVYLRLS